LTGDLVILNLVSVENKGEKGREKKKIKKKKK